MEESGSGVGAGWSLETGAVWAAVPSHAARTKVQITSKRTMRNGKIVAVSSRGLEQRKKHACLAIMGNFLAVILLS
jgi:hypothetical protein